MFFFLLLTELMCRKAYIQI